MEEADRTRSAAIPVRLCSTAVHDGSLIFQLLSLNLRFACKSRPDAAAAAGLLPCLALITILYTGKRIMELGLVAKFVRK
jgi:hypothetical protein